MILRLASGSVTPWRRSRKRSSASTATRGTLNVSLKAFTDLLALALAHEPVVDEHAGELVAHGSMNQQRGHRRVDPAGEAADHLAVAHLLADAADLLLGHRRGVPAHVAAADVLQEAGEDLRAVWGVDDLGVELDPVDPPLRALERGDRRLGGGGQRRESLRRLEHGVAVAHPAALLGRQLGQQPAVLVHGERGAPELPHLGALDAAAEVEHHRLHAVTDPQHRDAELEQLVVEPGSAIGVHRRGAAGEDQAPRLAPALTSSTETSCGRSSLNTPHSRTRRAISWEYWPPKSRTSTSSVVAAVPAGGSGAVAARASNYSTRAGSEAAWPLPFTTPSDAGAALAADWAPMPIAWSRCSCLPSV